MRIPLFAPITRLRPTPDLAPDEPAMPPRPRGSRRPHTDGKVAAVRRLIEGTTLTYGEIAARTGVGRASICRWTQDGGWKRPLFAPRATDTVPRARAGHKLRRRTLAARLTALAERHIAELEAAACVDPDKLAQALELLKMAKIGAMGRRRRRKGPAITLDGSLRPIAELCAADVDLRAVPRAALDDFLEHRAPPGHGPWDDTAQSALALSKTNWNNDALYDPLPVTMGYAQVLARVVKRMSGLGSTPYQFRFFM